MSPDRSRRDDGWLEGNQRALMAEVRRIGRTLERRAGLEVKPEPRGRAADLRGSALAAVVSLFRLSGFERDILLLCAGIELDSRFAGLCASAQSDVGKPYPTFGLALAALPGAHWSALGPSAPLRRWRLIEVAVASATPLTQSPVRIDERVLQYLTGIGGLDDRIEALLEPQGAAHEPTPSQRRLAARMAAVWTATQHAVPILQLWGGSIDLQRTLAEAACAEVGLALRAISSEALPTESRELAAFVDLWSREALLSRICLLIDCNDLDPGDRVREAAVARVLDGSDFPAFVTGREPRHARRRTVVGFEVPAPRPDEQHALWTKELSNAALELDGRLDQLVSQFQLSPPRIRAVCTEAAGRLAQAGSESSSEDVARALWNACRLQARLPLDELAQRVDSSADWDDLVLPVSQTETLREIEIQVRHRYLVYEEWGFAARTGRGLGITALFAGQSGTGKTLAAEVIANRLHLDLYRIDLSQVVSKYIGETEKNLRRVFDAAQQAGSCLLFDEADALFGKRGEVKDSMDRYANIEVGYLLQRMEAYRGLAILTTNQKDALDSAFMRRLRFVVDFPFPDAELRARIWQRIFPKRAPTNAIDIRSLARLDVAGGSIRNIALHAAFLAAEDAEPIGMLHLVRAARSECAKIGKASTIAEIGGAA